jgi:AraC family transcriptional activator of pobA
MDGPVHFLYFPVNQREPAGSRRMRKRRRTEEASPPSVVLIDAAPEEAQFEDFHIEPLRVRSVRRDWTIPAHVHHGLHQVFAIERGAVEAVMDGEAHSAQAPALILVPSAVPHAFRFSEDSTGRVLTLRPIRTFLDRPELAARLDSALFAHPAVLAFPPSPRWRDLVRVLGVLQSERGRRQDSPIDAAGFLLVATLGLMARGVAELRRDNNDEGASRTALFAAFERLVDDTLDRRLPTGAYAARLGVSVSTLDRLCRDHAGASAARYVRSRLYLDARRRLAYSDAAIQHIAEDLGFGDVGYFSRFISRHAALSPTALRRRLRAARQRETR